MPPLTTAVRPFCRNIAPQVDVDDSAEHPKIGTNQPENLIAQAQVDESVRVVKDGWVAKQPDKVVFRSEDGRFALSYLLNKLLVLRFLQILFRKLLQFAETSIRE